MLYSSSNGRCRPNHWTYANCLVCRGTHAWRVPNAPKKHTRELWQQCTQGFLDAIRVRTKGMFNHYSLKKALDAILISAPKLERVLSYWPSVQHIWHNWCFVSHKSRANEMNSFSPHVTSTCSSSGRSQGCTSAIAWRICAGSNVMCIKAENWSVRVLHNLSY